MPRNIPPARDLAHEERIRKLEHDYNNLRMVVDGILGVEVDEISPTDGKRDEN